MNPKRRRWPNGRTVEFPRRDEPLSDRANNSRNVICNILDFLEYLYEEPRSIYPNDYIYLTQKVKLLNSDKDMNIEYNDVKNIAAAEFAISRDIAMIDIQMNPQRND